MFWFPFLVQLSVIGRYRYLFNRLMVIGYNGQHHQENKGYNIVTVITNMFLKLIFWFIFRRSGISINLGIFFSGSFYIVRQHRADFSRITILTLVKLPVIVVTNWLNPEMVIGRYLSIIVALLRILQVISKFFES